MIANLRALALAHGLSTCAEVIGTDGIPQPAPADAALQAPPGTTVPLLLGQLVRRRLQPALVEALRRAWQRRPLERALLAWDVLHGALLDTSDDVASWRAECAAARDVLPAPGQSWVKLDAAAIDALVQSVAVPAFAALTADERDEPALGILRTVDATPTSLELIRQWSRVLSRAHLPTLASFQLANLFFHHGYLPALPDLVEVLLDSGARDLDSLLTAGDDADLRAYAHIRGLGNADQWERACAVPASTAPRPTLAHAEAALRCNQPTTPYEEIAALTSLEPPWRYSFRVMTVYAGTRIKTASFAKVAAMFVEKFGPELRLFYDAAAVAPEDVTWLDPFASLLVREVVALPHDPTVWQAAALLFGDEADAARGSDEVVARLQRQATLDGPP
jgi:hypothetical protein